MNKRRGATCGAYLRAGLIRVITVVGSLSLLHLGQVVITFRTLLHLGQNVITLRTLLHLGPFITFRPSTNTNIDGWSSISTSSLLAWHFLGRWRSLISVLVKNHFPSIYDIFVQPWCKDYQGIGLPTPTAKAFRTLIPLSSHLKLCDSLNCFISWTSRILDESSKMATAAVVPLTARSLSASCIAPTFVMSWPFAQYFLIAAFLWQSTRHKQTFLAGVLKNHNVQL